MAKAKYQELSPDRGTRSYWYDAAGNVTKRIDGNGWETDATYDLANRITSKTFPQATYENIAYSYDATSPYGVERRRVGERSRPAASTPLRVCDPARPAGCGWRRRG